MHGASGKSGSRQHYPGASIGIAQVPGRMTVDEALQQADQAMLCQQNSGEHWGLPHSVAWTHVKQAVGMLGMA